MKTLIMMAFVGLMAFMQSVNAQSTTFEKSYLDGTYQDSRSIVEAPDGNFLITGLERGTVDTAGSLYVSKIDPHGNILWQKYFDYKREDGGNHLMLSAKGEIIVTGHSEMLNGECDGYLLKLNSAGDVIWRKLIGEEADDVFRASVEDQNGLIYSVGRTENYGASDMQLWLHISDADGNALGNFVFGTTDYDYATSVALTPDGNLLISGISVGTPSSETDAILIKCDRRGNLLWQKRFTNPGTDGVQKILVTEDGNCLLTGKKQTGADHVQAWICNVTMNGDIRWQKTYGNTGKEEFFGAYKMRSGRVILAGSRPTLNDTLGDYWVCIIDDQGNILEDVTKGTVHFDIAADLCLATDETIWVTGKSRVTKTENQLFIVKTDMGGVLHNYVPSSEFQSRVFPIPASQICTFLTPGNYHEKTLLLYDLQGKLIYRKTYSESQCVLGVSEINIKMAFYRLVGENGALLLKGKLMFE